MRKKNPKQSNGADDKMSKQTNQKLEEEDDECSAPVQAAIINSCQEANIEEADAIQAAIQATYREAEENKREAEAEDVNTLVWLADHDDMIDVLEDSEDEPPTPKTNTNRMGAPPDLADYENNNKQQIAESMEVKMAHAAIEEAERPGQLDLEQPEEENRHTEFFPNPQSKNAKLANEDDPSRQLNVHGLTPEFSMATAGGKAEKELPSIHCRLVRFGLLMGPGKIIGARPASRSIKNDQDATMRVTYDSHNTKKILVKAANSAGLWVYREKNGKIAHFFRDVIDTVRKAWAKSSQVKRKREDGMGEGSQKNSKKPKTNISHVLEMASENLKSLDAQEEERQKKLLQRKWWKKNFRTKMKRH